MGGIPWRIYARRKGFTRRFPSEVANVILSTIYKDLKEVTLKGTVFEVFPTQKFNKIQPLWQNVEMHLEYDDAQTFNFCQKCIQTLKNDLIIGQH